MVQVKLNQIDFNDDCYLITFDPDISKLISSIKKISVLHYPILEQTSKDSYRIVCGYKRLLALKQLHEKKISTYCFETGNIFPSLELFMLTIFENVGTIPLNIVEKANIIHKLVVTFHVPDEIIADQFLAELNLGSNAEIIDRFLKIYTLKNFLKKAIVNDILSIDSVLYLSKLADDEAEIIYNLFYSLKIGKNKQREFLKLVDVISNIYKISISEIISSKSIQNIVENEKLTSPVKINRIKEQLKKIRFPNFSRTQENFNSFVKELKLPPSIILRPPDFFEGEKFSFELKFKNQTEFNKMIGQLKKFVEQNRMKLLEKLME